MMKRRVVLFPALAWAVACGANGASGPPNERVATLSQALTTSEFPTQGGSNARTNSVVDPELSVAAVGGGAFGLKWRRRVRGPIFGQPLAVSGVVINNHAYNLIIVTTMHNEIYAFDADDLSADAAPIYQFNLRGSAVPEPMPDPNLGSSGYGDIKVELGIVSTPVVSASDANGKRFLYVVAHSYDGTYYKFVVFKVNLDGSSYLTSVIPSQTLIFGASINNQRPALTLDQYTGNSILYIAFSSFGDANTYHGFVVVYDALAFTYAGSWNDTPNGKQGGIWMSGGGLVVDPSTNPHSIFLSTGNGDYDSANGDYGESVVGLGYGDGALLPGPFFTPYAAGCLNLGGRGLTQGDDDLGSGNVALFSTFSPHILVTGGKQAALYALFTNNLGGQKVNDTQCVGGGPVAVGPQDGKHEIHSVVGWDVAGQQQAFVWPNNSNLEQLAISNKAEPAIQKSGPVGPKDVMMTLSSLSSTNGTDGILWTSMVTGGDPNPNTAHGMLAAYNANTLAPVWATANIASYGFNAGANSLRDDVGPHAKFNPPMVANGSVYVGTFEGIETNEGGPSITTSFTAQGHPAILALGGVNDDFITLAFAGTDGHLNVATTNDGFKFAPVQKLSYATNDGPSIAFGNGVAYIAYRGTDANHTPNIVASTDRTFKQGLQASLLTGEKANVGPTVMFQPAVGSNPALVWLFWVGSDGRINWETSPVSANGSTAFANKQTMNETASAPIGALVDSVGNLVRIAWAGTDANHTLNVATIAAPYNATSYKKQTFAEQTLGKVVLHRNGFLYLGFSGVSDQFINLVTADPLATGFAGHINNSLFYPDDQTVYRDQSSFDGYDLTGFHGREYIAWTGVGNNNINLSVLNPGSLVAYSRRPSLPPSTKTGSISIVRQSGATNSLISLGADGAVYVRSTVNGVAQTPVALTGANFAPPSAGVVVANKTATESDGFFVGNDGKVYVTSETNDGAWQAPTPLSRAGLAAPGAQVTTALPDGLLAVFVVDTAGALQGIWWSPTFGWLAPVALTAAGFAPSGAALAAGTRSNGEVDVYTIGSDGALKFMAFTGVSWVGPLVLTVTNFAPPGAPVAAALDVHGYMNVFTIANDGGLYTKWDLTNLWSGPTLIPPAGTFPVGARLSAVNFNNTSLDVFAVDNTGAIDMFANAGLGWVGPTALAPAGSASPGAPTGASLQGTNQLDLFAVGVGGIVESVNTGTGWSAFTPQP